MAKVELCQCADAPAARLGRCVVMCGAEVPKGWFSCRPCALGNHTGQPCSTYVRGPIWHLDKTCATCGFDSAIHGVIE